MELNEKDYIVLVMFKLFGPTYQLLLLKKIHGMLGIYIVPTIMSRIVHGLCEKGYLEMTHPLQYKKGMKTLFQITPAGILAAQAYLRHLVSLYTIAIQADIFED
jgi:hypothetical protein